MVDGCPLKIPRHYLYHSYGNRNLVYFCKKQELLTIREHLESPQMFWWGPCCSSFLMCVVLFVLFFFVLCAMSHVSLDCQLLIATSVSSNLYLNTLHQPCQSSTFMLTPRLSPYGSTLECHLNVQPQIATLRLNPIFPRYVLVC